jgi:2-hydroxychromene-2-carboxylate isomerase
MAAHHIDFWFTMGSTYSYLSVSRLADAGVTFRWRPFHLLIILQEMKHVPFADKPTKSAYMWRDIERRAAMYGIPVKLPVPYPAKQSEPPSSPSCQARRSPRPSEPSRMPSTADGVEPT